MKYFFLILLSAAGASASEISIRYSSSNNLILSAGSCDELITQHKAICDWKKTLDPSFSVPHTELATCNKISTKQSSITVSGCLPDFVKAHQGKKLFKSGANCWGTALNFKKISERPRFIWSEEIRYWQDSPICRKLNPGEQKKPGDIINTYGPEYVFSNDFSKSKGELFWDALYPGRVTAPSVPSGYSGFHNFLHSETFVSDRITFGKDSPNHLDKFEFHHMNEVYGRSREVDCQENQSMSPHHREYQNKPKQIKGSKCDYFSLAYRCENFVDYFAKQLLTSSDEEILESIKMLQAMQTRLFPLITVANKTIPKSEIDHMLKTADLEAKETLDELSRSSSDKNHEMLLTLKYFTASGIRKSLELAGLTPPTEAL